MINIGLDPSFQDGKFGFCKLERGKITRLMSTSLPVAWRVIKDHDPEDLVIWIEQHKKKISHRTTKGLGMGTIFTMGANAMAPSWMAEALAAILEVEGYTVLLVPPVKGRPGKNITEKQFQERTGWMGRSSEHARDAYYIINSTWEGRAQLQGKL